jgi:hypothetical protein
LFSSSASIESIKIDSPAALPRSDFAVYYTLDSAEAFKVMIKQKHESFRARMRRLLHSTHTTDTRHDDSPPTKRTFERYRYEPLPPECAIRLLNIERDNRLSLQLKSFPLSKLPAYKALSYTWGKAICEDPTGNELGEPGTNHTILVNNKSFDISENLFDALMQFQNENIGWIWIDAICIDQANHEERSSQVLLMGDIYSKANQVVIWLGKDTEDVDIMLWAQDVLYVGLDNATEAREVDEQLLQALGIGVEKWFNNWACVERFFRRRRWYRRAWVFQEIVLASQIELRNGQTLLDWERLSLITRFGVRSGLSIPSAQQCMLISAHIAQIKIEDPLQNPGIRKSQAERYGMRTNPQHWYCYLFSLVSAIRSSQSSCEHDKIYAALGPTQKLVTRDIPELIIPDYASSWENVFVAFTTLLLRHLPTLILLSYVEGPGRSPSLPSWCPDYRFRSLVPLIANGSETPFFQLFSAAGPMGESEAIHNIHEETLSVNGMRIDVITQRSESLYRMIDYLEPDSIKPCLDICSKLPPVYPLTGQDCLEVLWRTMIIDQYYDVGEPQYHPAPPETSENFVAWIKNALAVELDKMTGTREKATKRLELVEQIQSWNQIFRSSSLRLPTPEEIFDLAEEIPKDHALSDRIFAVINTANRFIIGWGALRWSFGRSLFRTAEHQMFGLGPEKMEEGDEVWLIKETFVPFILRPQLDDRYTLVGEAYVHGIMHGEWLERRERLGKQDGFRLLEII